MKHLKNEIHARQTQGPLNGGVSNGGGVPDLDLSFLFRPFWDFPDLSGIFPGVSEDFPDLSFSSFSAY